MGVRISKNLAISTLRLDDYEEVNSKHSEDEFMDYRILKNRLTGNEMEEYSLQFTDSTEYQDYYDAFYWRLSQDHVVRTLHFIDCTKAEFCSSVYAAKLYIQRIPIKLSDIKDIPYPDNLYVLLGSLDGFDRIVQKAGYFEIQEHMVCINNRGEIKVWINDNLSRNYPDSMRSRIDGSEEAMVKRLINMIQKNTDKNSQPLSVSQYIYSQVSNPSFGDAMLLVREFARQHRVQIPNNFQCILQVINDSRYLSQPSHTQHSISNISKSRIQSSVPIDYGVDFAVNNVPGLRTNFQATRKHNQVSQLSRIINHTPSNSRLNTFHNSIMKTRSPGAQRQYLGKISRSPPPNAAAPILQHIRQISVSPQKIICQHYPRIPIPSVTLPQKRILQHHNNNNQFLLPKTVPYSSVYGQTLINYQQPVMISTPLDHRHQIIHDKQNLQTKIKTESERIIRKQLESKCRPKQPEPQHNNVRIEKQQQSKNKLPERKGSEQYYEDQPIYQAQSSQNNMVNEFINPFFQQQQSHDFQSSPSSELIINIRQKDRLLIQTPDDLRNEHEVQEIKKKKTQLLKQAKYVINRMRQQSSQIQAQLQQSNSQYQSLPQQSYVETQNQYNEEYLMIPHGGNNRLVMSFQRTLPAGNSEIVERMQGRQILLYHSPGDCHHIDPEIARDLLAMSQ